MVLGSGAAATCFEMSSRVTGEAVWLIKLAGAVAVSWGLVDLGPFGLMP